MDLDGMGQLLSLNSLSAERYRFNLRPFLIMYVGDLSGPTSRRHLAQTTLTPFYQRNIHRERQGGGRYVRNSLEEVIHDTTLSSLPSESFFFKSASASDSLIEKDPPDVRRRKWTFMSVSNYWATCFAHLTADTAHLIQPSTRLARSLNTYSPLLCAPLAPACFPCRPLLP